MTDSKIPASLAGREEALREAGLRVTHQRTLILGKLRQVEHISAEEIYNLLSQEGVSVNLATVYRVLSDLEEVGLVEKHSFRGNQSVYELCKHGHHDHLICVDCGRIIEFLDPVIESRQEEVGREHGFDISSHTMYLYGSCLAGDSCPERGKGEA